MAQMEKSDYDELVKEICEKYQDQNGKIGFWARVNAINELTKASGVNRIRAEKDIFYCANNTTEEEYNAKLAERHAEIKAREAELKEREAELKERYAELKEQQRENWDKLAGIMASSKVASCPKCHSTSISYDTKKLSVGRAIVGNAVAGPTGAIIGGLSSKKGYAVCLNCGKRWKI